MGSKAYECCKYELYEIKAENFFILKNKKEIYGILSCMKIVEFKFGAYVLKNTPSCLYRKRKAG